MFMSPIVIDILWMIVFIQFKMRLHVFSLMSWLWSLKWKILRIQDVDTRSGHSYGELIIVSPKVSDSYVYQCEAEEVRSPEVTVWFYRKSKSSVNKCSSKLQYDRFNNHMHRLSIQHADSWYLISFSCRRGTWKYRSTWGRWNINDMLCSWGGHYVLLQRQ